MSGICGLWDLRGAALPPDPLAPVMARLRRRGPDGAETWRDGPVALGHASLVTTPEAALERLPLRHADTGCVITADARIDNRDTLLTALGLDHAGQGIGDGELILRAYLRWGEDCVDHLQGDFAFAIWDPRRQVFFLGRDRTGMRQIIYAHRPGRLFAFATDARAVVTLPEVPPRLNEARVLDFLDGELEAIDDEVTFFEGVLRLPAAHCMTVAADGLRLRRYWRLEPGDKLVLPSDADYAEAFTEVFTEAVRCRLRSPETPGLMLSGGMDSGSVAAVAADLLAGQGRGPLPTFSGTGSDAERIETQLLSAAMKMPGLAPTALRLEDLEAMLPALRARLDDLEDPFGGQLTMNAAVYMAAARAGVKVMLDGVGGDTVFATGNLLLHAVQQRRYRDIPRIAREEALFDQTGRTYWQSLAQAMWMGLVPERLRHQRRARSERQQDRRRADQCIASRDLVLRHDLMARRARYRAHAWPTGLAHDAHRAAKIASPHLVAARERYDRVAAEQGIEPRDPYCDVRVMAFTLSLPEGVILRDGYRKYIQRVAMAERVPDAIRWNRIRDHHGFDFTRRLLQAYPELRFEGLQCSANTQRLLRSDISDRIDGRSNDIRLDLWARIVFLEMWVRGGSF